MESRLRRALDRLTAPPRHIPDRAIASPIVDGDLGVEMHRSAEQAASENDGLDFSIDSLRRVQERLMSGDCDDEALYRFGAYLGEVLRRNAPGTAWAWPATRRKRARQEPAIAVGKWVTEPLDWVDRIASGKAHPETSLIDYAEQVRAMAADPSADTADDLGLRTRFATNGEALHKTWDRFRRRRWRRS
jgi:hypothetical protein